MIIKTLRIALLSLFCTQGALAEGLLTLKHGKDSVEFLSVESLIFSEGVEKQKDGKYQKINRTSITLGVEDIKALKKFTEKYVDKSVAVYIYDVKVNDIFIVAPITSRFIELRPINQASKLAVIEKMNRKK